MAKIKMHLNGTDYNIDKFVLDDVMNNLKTHFSTTVVGTGSTIELDGAIYNIDSTKLATATDNFIVHLGTIAGSGEKVVIGGVEYDIDAEKVSEIAASLDADFRVVNITDTNAVLETEQNQAGGQTAVIN